MKKAHIVGGGTVHYVRSHLALAAPAYGSTARMLYNLCHLQQSAIESVLHLTRMAGGPRGLETTLDVMALAETLVQDPDTKIIFFPVAMCDFTGTVGDPASCGRHGPRLDSRRVVDGRSGLVTLQPFPKAISTIRKTRKDIFLVGFKMTTGVTEDEQYIAGLNLCKEASCNLVLANDTGTRLNMVVTPEEARYHVTRDRTAALEGLVEMAYMRSHLTFTRSMVISADPVSWFSELVPSSLREVVDYCIGHGAYKPFRGMTAGHFAVKMDDTTFLTSQRKTDFNKLPTIGLVRVVTDGPDSVIAYGSKPSVGGQSQRIVFHDHQEYDCIVHFHSPKKDGSKVPNHLPAGVRVWLT